MTNNNLKTNKLKRKMELKGEVSASLNFLKLPILFQEDIREYMVKYHSVKQKVVGFFCL